jgi:hypothetical protein
MWTFETRSFRVVWTITPCYDLDLSWDETGETAEKITSGEWDAFDSAIKVYHRPTGLELGAAYLGQSIYANPAEFRDHIGIKAKSRQDGGNYGSYFSDMVRGAVAEARATLAQLKAA